MRYCFGVMKIVFLQDDFPPTSFGGAGISAFELARAMHKAGHEVAVITTCRKQSEAGESEYEGLKVFRVATSYPSYLRAYVSLNNRSAVREVERLLKGLQPDVVHAHNIHQYLSYASLRAAKKYARAVVWTARDTMAITFGKLDTKQYLERLDPRVSWLDNLRQARKRYNPLRNFYIKRCLQQADIRTAISHALKEALERNGIAPVEVVYNGIELGDWKVDPVAIGEFKSRFGLEGKQVLLLSGRLSDQKGGMAALRALKQIVQRLPSAVLVVASAADEYIGLMQAQTRRLGLKDKVVFTGWLSRDEIKSAYAAADAVLMPSLYLDAFGRVNIEAMASNKPVVGTRYGGTPEIVEDGKTGYIIDPRDANEVAEKTLEFLRNPQKAQAFGQAGHERAQQRFSLEASARGYLECYRKALLEKPRSL